MSPKECQSYICWCWPLIIHACPYTVVYSLFAVECRAGPKHPDIPLLDSYSLLNRKPCWDKSRVTNMSLETGLQLALREILRDATKTHSCMVKATASLNTVFLCWCYPDTYHFFKGCDILNKMRSSLLAKNVEHGHYFSRTGGKVCCKHLLMIVFFLLLQ